MKRILGTICATAALAACSADVKTPGDTTDPQDGPAIHLPAAASPWTLLGDVPAPRSEHTAIYDAARDRMLVFGGGANDLWAQPFSGPNAGGWERIARGGAVPPPVDAVPVIDEGNSRLLLFADDSLDRAWVLPLDHEGDWSVEGFGGAPSIELGFSLAADPSGRRLFAYTSGSPEVYELPLDGGGSWTRVAGAPSYEGFSCRDNLVFDGAHARLLVLSGGWPRGDVYALSLAGEPSWTRLNQDQAWFDYGDTTIYDAGAERFLALGPAGSDWIWSFAVGDESPQWEHVKVSGTAPGVRWGRSGIYDAAHGRFVLFGGAGNDLVPSFHADTWAISLDDAPAWSTVGTLDRTATALDGTALAVEPAGDVVRFGGWGTSAPVQTQRFDPATAMFAPLGDSPAVTVGWSAGAWDPFGDRLVTFGGYNYLEQDQTWALDALGSSWTQIGAEHAHPGARSHHTMVLDSTGRRMLVFGGIQNSSYPPATYFDDVWALSLDGDAWTKLDVAGPGPSARASYAAAFDDEGRRMLVYGGWNDHASLGDTWMLELEPSPHWVAVHASAAPPLLSSAFAAFDPVERRFLLVGNVYAPQPGTFDGASVWALSTDGDARWERYCQKGTRPAAADGAVWTPDGLFITSKASAWRFDSSAPTCD